MQLSMILAALTTASSATAATSQLWNFTDHAVTIENSALRSNGHLLLTTFDNASLYTLDTLAETPQASLVAKFPGATAIGGIAAIDADKFAILGGVRGSNYSYTDETVYTIDFSSGSSTTPPIVNVVAKIPDAVMLNGLASLPSKPHIVLATDSRLGSIFRIDTQTGDWEIAITDNLFAAPDNATIPIGINGIKIADDFAYFTNTARTSFGRVPITEDGYRAGDVEIVAVASGGYAWDDFVIDSSGNIYAAQTQNAAGQIFLNGTYTTIAGGGDSTFIHRPTSVAISEDSKTLFVTTGGNVVNGVTYSGQVIAVGL
ncbi:hypothetical protein CkaCkLH20_10766 [Colletotrichum karsti]|uniref:SMP-30/Gluconolactonase/LRE-like region domain-containing protein n=1 Tax=Colletotrichum karsti TaxID=1095194 RepID=A0A9P6LGV2_9PEZI|nr:uncharacterized protein CkaCkLH20_10766 [Colletotrichum karsti]KAF9871832.1 hypothetical protein CkaCkLH20_10766 [Colletotrichum karsti]